MYTCTAGQRVSLTITGPGPTLIPMGRYGQPNPVMCDLSMVEHYHERKKIENSLSHVYEGGNFLHSRFIFLTMDVDISHLVDKYKWVKSSNSSLDDHVHYLLS